MSRKPILSFFCPRLSSGGAEMHLARLLNCLVHRDFDIHLIVAERGGSYESLLEDEIHIHDLDLGQVKSATLRLIRATKKLPALLDRIHADVFVSIMDNVNYFCRNVAKKAKRDVKWICMVQTSIAKSLEFNFNLVNRWIYQFLPGVYSRADLVIALSDGVMNEIIERSPHGHCVTINNIGITVGDASQTHTGSPAPHSVSVCGRLLKLKGFDTVIRAISQLTEEFPEVSLKIIGSGPEESGLRQLAEQLGIKNRVHFLGFITAPEMEIATSTVFVLSSHYEGFGNVIVESMAVGTPVVATNCPYGPGEIIEDGVNGILVPVGDSSAIADSIASIFRDPEFRDKLSVAGRQRALDFLPDPIAEKYEHAIRGILTN